MKVVILAGGLGTRISEETAARPKPMVEIGPEPILWHIMKIYYRYGYDDFIICAGYKQAIIKDYFSNYALNHSDIEIDLKKNSLKIISSPKEEWNVTVVDTGLNTMTGGRLKRIQRYVESDREFMFTYGDGLADIRIDRLVQHHRKFFPIVTLTAVQPPGRFGSLVLEDGTRVKKFSEKPPGDGQWINAGFYVSSNEIFDFINGDGTILEVEPLEKISAKGRMRAFLHHGYWKPMDTLTDKKKLEDAWFSGIAPWKVWVD